MQTGNGYKFEVIKTDCALCVHSCGLDVHVQDGKIIKVEGMAEHPISKGYICPRAQALVEYVYSKERLTHPLIKRAGGWEKISWGNALDIIADRLTRLKEEDGARALSVYCGSVGVENIELSAFAQRFRGVYGTPNFLSVESFCYHALITARLLTFGRYLMEQPEGAKYIILWAHNPDSSFPTRSMRIEQALNSGGGIAVVDLRRTPFADKGLFVRPAPETDCALALAMIHIIIFENLYDEAFVNDWTLGFEQLKEHVRLLTPQWAEGITGVPPDDIKKMARYYARAEKGCIIQGTCSLDQQENGIQVMRAFSILQAITGNVNKPGTWVQVPFPRISDLRVPVQEEPIGVKEYPLFYNIWGRKYPYGHALALPDAVLKKEPYPIKAMIVTGGNPAVTFPDVKLMHETLEKLEFVTVMDVFMTDTAKMADLVLPANTFLEKSGLAFTYAVDQGVPYIMLRKKVIDSHQGWPEWKFWTELAYRMGYQGYFPWQTEEEVIEHLLEPTGVTLKQLKENPSGVFYDSIKYGIDERLFKTPSGKIELYSKTLEEHGHDPLPVHRETRVSEKRNPRLKKEYPLILLVGNRNIEYTHSQFRELAYLRRLAPEPEAEMHPQTAEKYNISDEEMIVIETPKGAVKIKAKLKDHMGPDMVSIPKGWSQAKCNELIDINYRDPIMGIPSIKNVMCRIKPL